MFARSLSFDVDFEGNYVLYFLGKKAELVRKGYGRIWLRKFPEEIVGATIFSGKIYVFFKRKIVKLNLYGEKVLEIEAPVEISRGKVNPDTEEIMVLGEGKTYCYSDGTWKDYNFPNGYVHKGRFVGISSGKVEGEEAKGVEDLAFNNSLFVMLTEDGEIWIRRLDGSGNCFLKEVPQEARIKLFSPILQVITPDGAYSLPVGTMNLGKEIFLDSFTKVFTNSRGIASFEGVFCLKEGALYDMLRRTSYSLSGNVTFIRGGETLGVLLEGYKLFLPSEGKIFELLDNFDKVGKPSGEKITLSRGLFLAIFDFSSGEVLRRYNSLDEILDHMANRRGEAVLIFPEHVEIYKEEETVELKLKAKDFFLGEDSLFLATEEGLYEIFLSGGAERKIEEGEFELVDLHENHLAAVDFMDRLYLWEIEGHELHKKWEIELDSMIIDMKVSEEGIFLVTPSHYMLVNFDGKIVKREILCRF